MCAAWEGGSRQGYLGWVARAAAERGWAVQGVAPERGRPPWAYTVGMTARGRPELLVTGMPVARARVLLDDVAAYVLHDGSPCPGERMPLLDGTTVQFVALPHPDVRLHVAVELYGPVVRALQVVWADGRGRWPWDRGFRPGGGQPVLGRRQWS